MALITEGRWPIPVAENPQCGEPWSGVGSSGGTAQAWTATSILTQGVLLAQGKPAISGLPRHPVEAFPSVTHMIRRSLSNGGNCYPTGSVQQLECDGT